VKDLLDKVAQAERDEEALDQRLDALAEAALAGGSAGAQPKPDFASDEARLRAAYAPLSSEVKAAMVSRIAGEVRAGATSGPGAEPAKAAEPPRRVFPLRRGLAWALPLVAAAASVFFGVWTVESPSPFRLEHYQLEVSSGAASLERSSPPGTASSVQAPARLAPDAELVLVLRPERPVASSVAAHAYARDPSGNLRQLTARAEAAPSGALRLFVGARPEWPERGELVIWIGAAGATPKAAELESDAPLTGDGWQRLEQSFVRSSSF
jgi:hypothetical protein